MTGREEGIRTVTVRRPFSVDRHTREDKPHTDNALQEQCGECHDVYCEMMVRDVHYYVEEECCEWDAPSEAEVGEYSEDGTGRKPELVRQGKESSFEKGGRT